MLLISQNEMRQLSAQLEVAYLKQYVSTAEYEQEADVAGDGTILNQPNYY
jgi:hypothetical protein